MRVIIKLRIKCSLKTASLSWTEKSKTERCSFGFYIFKNNSQCHVLEKQIGNHKGLPDEELCSRTFHISD